MLDTQHGLRRDRSKMIRITLHYVWSLAEDLEPLSRVDASRDCEDFEVFMQFFSAQNTLELLLRSSVFSGTLRSSRQLGEALLNMLEEVNTRDPDKSIESYTLWRVKNAYTQFKVALLAELGTFPTYFVSQKGSHDTITLLDNPSRMFPGELADKVPEALFDVAEAGKALCYELPSACGFHLFRATEAVLRRYYTHVTGGRPQPKVRNISVYIRAMRKLNCGDEKILSVVDQMSKLHRNPLIHPEVALTLDEAISILGISRSAVTAMLAELPDVPKTTTSAAQGDI